MANIVPSGSADRSGVIRVNDVIVKVDDEDVQGQPLSTLRNLILGRQGSYVVLAFRRMTGTELYYFDVELLRGSPEYFESLKKTQAIADEKEKLITQVRQQEQEIQQLKQTSSVLRTSAGSMPSSMGQPAMTTEQLMRELQTKMQEAKRLDELMKQTKEDSMIQKDAEQALDSLRSENRRYASIELRKFRTCNFKFCVHLRPHDVCLEMWCMFSKCQQWVRCKICLLFSLCRMEEQLKTTRNGIAELQQQVADEKQQQAQEKSRMEKQVQRLPNCSPTLALLSPLYGYSLHDIRIVWL